MEPVLNLRRKIKLAYEQAPWRIELRRGVWLLLIIVVCAALAAFYTDISARTNALGRTIQQMQLNMNSAYSLRFEPDPDAIVPIEELNMQIAALRLQLAQLTNRQAMQVALNRAGYKEAQPENVIYLAVPGYQPVSTAELASQNPPTFVAPVSPTMLYNDSLLDAIQGGWKRISDMVQSGVLP